MKIAIVLFQKDRGGVDSYLKTLIKEWSEEDEIILITNRDNKGLKVLEALVSKGRIKVVFTKAFDLETGFLGKVMRFLNLPLYLSFLSLRYRYLLKKFLGSKIMIQNGTYPGSLDGLAVLKAAHDLSFEKRMMVIHHGAIHGRMRKMFFAGWVDFAVHRWATDLVSVSRATRKTLIDYFGFDSSINPVRVIHNAVELADSIPENKLLTTSTEKYKLGIVGRVERYKGHEDLIIGVSHLDQTKRELFSVHIIGEGDKLEIKRLKKLAYNLGVLDNIIFEGFVEGEAREIISELDLCLMLTKDFEGFGLTVAESMSVGTPVVLTKVGAVEEFTNESTVTYVEPESPYQISKVLNSFLEDKDEFRLKAKKARSKVAEYGPGDMVKAYKLLLEN